MKRFTLLILLVSMIACDKQQSTSLAELNEDIVGKWKFIYAFDSTNTKIPDYILFYDSLVIDNYPKYRRYKTNVLVDSGTILNYEQFSHVNNNNKFIFNSEGRFANNYIADLNHIKFKGKDTLLLYHLFLPNKNKALKRVH